MSSEPFIGEISMFAGTFPPAGWALCDGQLLAIVENEPLFTLIGTTYGGDGVTTFALPDLRGRIPSHTGTGPAGTIALGQRSGSEFSSSDTVAANFETARGVAVTEQTTQIYSASQLQHPALCVNFIIALYGIYPTQ